ncbi:hypothetical protein CLIB1423_04S02036 [[Candida] railenensis]|uniref:SUMO ligase n=1 Tax=[Candida] railenensis TaxID=45579 RepID=A0A9P0QNG5_9ASCO|nr:hypothetical protein CLIB1423_04S02036 [[Candida] railenensis]
MSGGSSPNLITISSHEYNETLRIIGLMKVPNLKDLARALGLIVGGKKSDLFDRIFTELERARTNHDFIAIAVVRILILKILQNSPLPRYSALHGALTAGVFSYSPVETTVPESLIPRGVSIFKSPVPWSNSNANSTSQNTSSTVRTHGNGAVRPSAAVIRQETASYKGHVLYFRESPFYRLKRMIHGAPQVAPPCSSRGTSSHKFILNDIETNLLFGDGSGPGPENVDCLILCGIANPRTASTSSAYIQFPHPVELRVNGTLVKDGVKGIKNKLGTATPAKITNLIKKSPQLNQIEMVYLDTKESYLFYCYIVENVSSSEILDRVLSNRHIHYNATTSQIQKEYAGVDGDDDDDDDIIVATHSISLRDPVTRARMNYPCKSIFCEHIQCFDALAYIQLQSQVPTWQCPICNKDVNVNDLAISDYYHEILRMTDSEVDNVSLLTDGSWEVIKEPERNEDQHRDQRQANGVSVASDRTSKSKEPEIEIISLDSESEDEGDVDSNEREAQQDTIRQEQEQREQEVQQESQYTKVVNNNQTDNGTTEPLFSANTPLGLTWSANGSNSLPHISNNIATQIGDLQHDSTFPLTSNQHVPDIYNFRQQYARRLISERQYQEQLELERSRQEAAIQLARLRTDRNLYFGQLNNLQQKSFNQLSEQSKEDYSEKQTGIRTQHESQKESARSIALQQHQASEQGRSYSLENIYNSTNHSSIRSTQNLDQANIQTEVHPNLSYGMNQSSTSAQVQAIPVRTIQEDGYIGESLQRNVTNISKTSFPPNPETSGNTNYVEIISSDDEIEKEQNGSAGAYQNTNITTENNGTEDLNVEDVAHEIEMSLSGQLNNSNDPGTIPDDEIPIGQFQDPNEVNSGGDSAQPLSNPRSRRALDDDSSGSDLTPFEELPLSALNGYREANNESLVGSIDSNNPSSRQEKLLNSTETSNRNPSPSPPPFPVPSLVSRVNQSHTNYGAAQKPVDTLNRYPTPPPPAIPKIPVETLGTPVTNQALSIPARDSVHETLPPVGLPNSENIDLAQGTTDNSISELEASITPVAASVTANIPSIPYLHDNPATVPSISEGHLTSNESQSEKILENEQSSVISSAALSDKQPVDRLRIEAERRRKENEDRRSLANEHYRAQNSIREKVRSHVMSYNNASEINGTEGKTSPSDVSIRMEDGEVGPLQNNTSNNPVQSDIRDSVAIPVPTATATATRDDIVGVLGIAFTPTYLKDSFLEGNGSTASPTNVNNHDLYGRIGDMSLSSGKKKRTISPVPRSWNKRLNSTSAVQTEINDIANDEKNKD